MAKGNDGNYLQHGIEVSAAHALLDKSSTRRLHVVLAHGMAPYEPLDPPRPPREFRRLRDALCAAAQPPKADESLIVRAFRDTWARATHYPNSAELLRSVVGTDRLSGGITEICEQKIPSACRVVGWNRDRTRLRVLARSIGSWTGPRLPNRSRQSVAVHDGSDDLLRTWSAPGQPKR